ncbi:hypothetical protein N9A28_02175 [Sulfurimonas sp.]|nr:hypothetical protein [Sulfurimonas sp.]
MYKSIVSGVAVATMLVMSGCSSKVSSMPTIAPAELSVKEGTYKVLGQAQGTAECKVLLGMFNVGEASCPTILDSYASMLTGIEAPGVKSAAITRAVESYPTADAMVSPKVTIEKTSFVVIKTAKAVIKGKVVEYKE